MRNPRWRRSFLVLAVLVAVAWVASAPVRRWLHWGDFLRRFETVEAESGVPTLVSGIHGRRWGRGAATLILVHGVHPEGGHEPRMARLATLFAEEGFTVHVPHLPSLAAFDPEPDVVADLDRYFRSMGRRHGCFGVVGISVGAGVALRALEDQPVTGVLSVGGHADLRDVLTHHRASGGTAYARRVMEAVGDVSSDRLAALSPRRPPRGPVWVLHGEADPLVPASQAGPLCALAGCGRVVVTPWLGHTDVHGESPVPVLALLDDAVQSMRGRCESMRAFAGVRSAR